MDFMEVLRQNAYPLAIIFFYKKLLKSRILHFYKLWASFCYLANGLINVYKLSFFIMTVQNITLYSLNFPMNKLHF